MSRLTDRLREAKTIAVADPILIELGANRVITKLVEASILQRLNPSPASYEYGMTMLNEAIKELEKDEEPASPESPGLKVKGKGFVKEEELDNHNVGDRGAGSEQSTDNTEPYPLEGKKEGDEDMTNAPDTENQMSETGDEAPFPKNLSEEMGGLHPDIAKGIGMKMPDMPEKDAAMDTLKQTRYTVRQFYETVVKPMQIHSRKQDNAIRKLSQKIRETEARAGIYTLDMDVIKQNAPAQVRETTQIPHTLNELVYSRTTNKGFDLTQARNEIIAANNQMSS